MNQLPRLSELKLYQKQHFNDLHKMLHKGYLPAALLSPAIINMHNRLSPDVAKITYGSQPVSLDALAVLYASDGFEARRLFRDSILTKVRHDPVSSKVPVKEDRHTRHLRMMEDLQDD